MSVDPPLIARFLSNACPDHHVRDGESHMAVKQTAGSMLRHHPDIAHANLATAIVCGDLEGVERRLRERPSAATETLGPKGSAEAAGSHFILEATSATTPLWEPLHYLCFTRLDHASSNDHAVAMARLLLDHGANPNAFFFAGSSHYTPLTGVIGAGEEGRARHPRWPELVPLLLERGADPFDIQVFYNLGFDRNLLSYLELAHAETVRRGTTAVWKDPEWRMIDMGGYGHGTKWLLGHALEWGDDQLIDWMLAHGAKNDDMMRHPGYRAAPSDLHTAARLNRPDAISRLLDQGVLDAEPELAKVTWKGATPLTWLPGDEAQAVEIIRLLRASGTDVSLRYEGMTPEERARKRFMFDAAEALR